VAVTSFVAPSAPTSPVFSREEIRLLSVGLLTLATISERLVFDCLDKEPPTGSPASEWFHGRDGGERNHAMDAFLMMQYATLSAADHLRSVNAVLRAPRMATTSTVTLVRAALEAFARAWHLASASSLLELQRRHLSAMHAELRYAELLSEQIYRRDGQPADATESRASYRAEMLRLGLGEPARLDLTKTVVGLLNVSHQDESGPITYSSLSSVAHAQRIGVNSFVYTDETGGVAGLTATRQVVLDIVAAVSLAGVETIETIAKVFGNQARHVDVIRGAIRRINSALSRFDER
jgi:hypothetical protein